MEAGNNIKKYSGADIEKYHTGQLSPKEMHDLEKAALDDPFLADAIEGYAVKGVNATADIKELEKRLAAETQSAKMVKMDIGKPGFPWLKVAAMFVVLAGAGLLVYQFGFNKKSANIAQTKQKEEAITNDTDRITVLAQKDSSVTFSNVNNDITKTKGTTSPFTITTENSGSGLVKIDTVSDSLNYNVSRYKDIATNVPVTPGKISENAPLLNEKKEQKTDDVLVREDVKNKATGTKKEADADGVADKLEQDRQQNNSESAKRGIVSTNRSLEKNARQKDNYFRGQVTDANNNAVPFANITSIRDNGGTYTDARGYFNLVSPDTVIDVQIRSVGFENNQAQLRNSLSNNQVVLQNDRSLQEVVISAKKPNADARKINAPVKVEEPEPADGWDNYDTYLSNNLKTPNEFKTNESGGGEVKVSFEVDKYGEPVNIKIEKSLCGSCDKEAIRLVKEGPKWKRKAKKGRTTVTISF